MSTPMMPTVPAAMPAAKSTGKAEETLCGEVVRIVAERDEWKLIQLAVEGRSSNVTCKGTTPVEISIGIPVEMGGRWVRDPKWGRQFEFFTLSAGVPTGKRALSAYLETIDGIGPVRAQTIVEALGDDCVAQILTKPERLCDIDGIGKETAASIAQSLKDRQSTAQVDQTLCAFGFGRSLAKRVREHFGAGVLDVILHGKKPNPYRLVEVSGVTLGRIDHAVLANGLMSTDAPERAAAIVVEALKQAAGSGGHTWQTDVELWIAIKAMRLSAPISQTNMQEGITQGVTDESLVRVEENGLALATYAKAEAHAVSVLARMLKNPTGEIGGIERLGDIASTLTGEQRQAVENAVKHRVSVLTGGPGTGKTYTLKAIIEAIGPHNVQLLAPTGKARKRAEESTGHGRCATVHKFISQEEGARVVTIIDESSMVDVKLFSRLLTVISKREGSRLVIVGDVDQLPSIGAGAVLRDLIGCGEVPTVRLNQVQRQSADSRIIANAHRINNGLELITDQSDDWQTIAVDDGEVLRERVVAEVERLVNDEGLDLYRDVQVLCGQSKSAVGTQALNDDLRAILNPPRSGEREITRRDSKSKREVSRFRLRDKVIITKNDYNLDVVNGDQGQIVDLVPFGAGKPVKVTVKVNDGNGGRDVDFGLEEMNTLQHAYAITVHKSQGSEYSHAIVIAHKSAWWALQRNLLYTGVTRAKRVCILAGNHESFGIAIKTAMPERATRLGVDLASKLEVQG